MCTVWPAGYHRFPGYKWFFGSQWAMWGTGLGLGLRNRRFWLSSCPSGEGSSHPAVAASLANWKQMVCRLMSQKAKYSVALNIRLIMLPQGHDMPIGTETSDAEPRGHRHNVGSKYEGGLCDVVFIDAVLRRHRHHLSLFLWADHSILTVRVLLRRRRGGRPASPWPFFLLLRGVGLIPGLVNVGHKSPAGFQLGHAQNGSLQAHYLTCDDRTSKLNVFV